MTERKRTLMDAVPFIALAVVALTVNLSLVVLTDVDVFTRWVATVVSGVVAAATAYAVVSRRTDPPA